MSNFDPGFPLELIVGVIVTDEEADVAELLRAVVLTVDGIVWVAFCETELLLVLFAEPVGVVILAVAVDTKAVTVSVLDVEDCGFVGCLTVLVGRLVWLEVTVVTFSVGLALWFPEGTEFCAFRDPSGPGLSTAAFSSASTSSAPRISAAQAPRAPIPIVPRAGRGGLAAPRPSVRGATERPLCARAPAPQMPK